MTYQKAKRKQVKLKLGLFGPSGSGKTVSALKLAYGLCGDRSKIAVLDTENASASLYSKDKKLNIGEFDTDVLTAPFSPERYIEKIKDAAANGYEVLIIDSVSHEWFGTGGCLEMQNKLGGKYQDWAPVTKEHNKFVNAILQVPIHVIITGRTKEEYAMTQGSDGRIKVEKAGTGIIQRDGVEYEVTISFTLDIRHNATSNKDRTGLFMDKPPFTIDEGTGQILKKWTEEGVEDVVGQGFEDLVKQFGLEPVTDICKIIWEDKANASKYLDKIEQSTKIDPIYKDNIYKFINSLVG